MPARAAIPVIILIGLLSPVAGAQDRCDWKLSYNWYWLNSEVGNGSSVIDEIAEYRDTLYVFSNAGTSYTVDGFSWQEYDDGYQGRLQGLTIIDGEKYFIDQSSILSNRDEGYFYKGIYYKGMFLNSHGLNWQGYQWDYNRSAFLVAGGDSLIIDVFVNEFTRPLDNWFVYRSGTDIYILKWDEKNIVHLSSLSSNAIVNSYGVDDRIYLQLDNAIAVINVEGGEPVIEQKRSTSEGAYLINVCDTTIILNDSDEMEVLCGSSSRCDLSLFRYDQISRIWLFNVGTFANSRNRGVAYLSPTGLSTYWSLNGALIQVDGVYPSEDGQNYALVRGKSFPQFPNSDGGIMKSRKTDPLNVIIEGKEWNFMSDLNLKRYNIRMTSSTIGLDLVNLYKLEDRGYLLSDDLDVYWWRPQLQGVYPEQVFCSESYICGLGSINHCGNQIVWVGTSDTLYLLDDQFGVTDKIWLKSARSVTSAGDYLIIGSYVKGLYSYQPELRNLQRVVMSESQSSLNISETGYMNGIFYLLSNQGIFYQDSGLFAGNVNLERPVFLVPVNRDERVEVNGSFFYSSIRNDDHLLIATTRGVLKWNIPELARMDYAIDRASFLTRDTESGSEVTSFTSQAGSEYEFIFDEELGTWREMQLSDIDGLRDGELMFMGFDGLNEVYVKSLRKTGLRIPIWGVSTILVSLLLLFWIYVVWRKQRSRIQAFAQSESLSSSWASDSPYQSMETGQILKKLIDHDLKGGLLTLKQMFRYFSANPSTMTSGNLDSLDNHLESLITSTMDRVDELLSDKEEIQISPLDDLLDSAIEEVGSYAAVKRVVIRRIGERGLYVRNKNYLMRCLNVILSNAVKFSPRQGVVDVLVKTRSGVVRIDVMDQGEGFPQAALEDIRNIEKKPGSFGEQGMGIALKLIHNLAQQNGGYLKIGNRLSGGAVVTIHWISVQDPD